MSGANYIDIDDTRTTIIADDVTRGVAVQQSSADHRSPRRVVVARTH